MRKKNPIEMNHPGLRARGIEFDRRSFFPALRARGIFFPRLFVPAFEVATEERGAKKADETRANRTPKKGDPFLHAIMDIMFLFYGEKISGTQNGFSSGPGFGCPFWA